jgi:hypothetical protein
MTANIHKVILLADDITVDAGTQMRASNNEATIDEYAEAIRQGVEFPPLSVVYDGTNYWLYDGFHRHAAAMKAGAIEVECNVQVGTLEDARCQAIGANCNRGLPRTNLDKRKAVAAALAHPASADMAPTRQVAEKCGVCHTLVANNKKDNTGKDESAVVHARQPADDYYKLPPINPGYVYIAMSERPGDIPDAHAQIGENSVKPASLVQRATIMPHPDSPDFVLIQVDGPRREMCITQRGVQRKHEVITRTLKVLGVVPNDDIWWSEDLHDGSSPGWFRDSKSKGDC